MNDPPMAQEQRTSMMKVLNRRAEILLAEDNEIDVLITRKAFERAGLPADLHRVENGKECMAFLRRQGPYAEVPEPDMLLLDLNMPVMNGKEVLAEIVRDKELCQLPVVILTTSSAEQDLLEMYQLRCSSYITKPVDAVEFNRFIGEFWNYWFKVVELPPE